MTRMHTFAIIAGRTDWSSRTYKTVGRFHGSRTMEVAVKDERGKPALLAERSVVIVIVCPDGARYRFTSRLEDFMREHIGDNMNPACTLVLHGMKHPLSVRYEKVPPFILEAYRSASRPLRAIFRYCGAALRALPKFRPLGKRA